MQISPTVTTAPTMEWQTSVPIVQTVIKRELQVDGDVSQNSKSKRAKRKKAVASQQPTYVAIVKTEEVEVDSGEEANLNDFVFNANTEQEPEVLSEEEKITIGNNLENQDGAINSAVNMVPVEPLYRSSPNSENASNLLVAGGNRILVKIGSFKENSKGWGWHIDMEELPTDISDLGVLRNPSAAKPTSWTIPIPVNFEQLSESQMRQYIVMMLTSRKDVLATSFTARPEVLIMWKLENGGWNAMEASFQGNQVKTRVLNVAPGAQDTSPTVVSDHVTSGTVATSAVKHIDELMRFVTGRRYAERPNWTEIENTDRLQQILERAIANGEDVCQTLRGGTFLHHLLESETAESVLKNIVYKHHPISALKFQEIVTTLVKGNCSRIFNISHSSNLRTPLHWAVNNVEVNSDTLRLLHEHGVNFNAICKQGDSVLMYALLGGRSLNCLTTLVEFGADWTTSNKQGATVLHYAAGNPHVKRDATQYLLDLCKGSVSANQGDASGDTPLHYFTNSCNLRRYYQDWRPHVGKLEALLHRGADIVIKNRGGSIPYDRLGEDYRRRNGAIVSKSTCRILPSSMFSQRLILLLKPN